MSRPHSTFVWNDLLTTDVEKAKAFVARTPGWTYEDFSLEGQPYFVIRSGDDIVGGLVAIEQGTSKPIGPTGSASSRPMASMNALPSL